jgi:large subunit ribosomal protein L9
MKVILKENYPKLGYVGDTVEVKRGYARNYLIPRGFAVEAGSRSAKQFAHVLSGILVRKTKLKNEAEVMASRMGSITLEFTLKFSEGGKSFGAITARDIEAALKDKGYLVDRRQIRLSEPLKSPGSFLVEVKLHSEVSAQVPVAIEAEKENKKEIKEDKEAPKKKREGKKKK